MKSHPLPFAFMLFLLFLIACDQEGCQKWQQVATKVKDTDGDGWMDEATNQKIDLFIEEISFGLAAGPFSLVVDDLILVDNGPNAPANAVATSRYAGQWHVGNLLSYSARVKIFTNGDTETAVVRDFPFNNRDSSYQIAFNLGGNQSVAFLYRTVVSTFADPSPNDAEADADADGITDREEAELARGNFRIGDPGKKDIVVCIGYTAPKWALKKRSVERIATVFLNRDFNILLADEASDLPGLTPGQILFEGPGGNLITPAETAGVRIDEVGPIRPRHISAVFDPFTHMLAAAEKTNMENGDFGFANLPGRNLVIRSHFFQLGPEPFGFQYQAITAMHELGHNFGLCHPNQSDENCPSGAIPVAERNGASSCMGSPAADGGLFNGIIPNMTAIMNAFNRPLDYSPTQWNNIDVASSRN
jgi:hypothetical protein